MRHTRRAGARLLAPNSAVVAALGAFSVATVAIAPATAATPNSAIVSPKPSQKITRSTVRFVVRAGPEHGDLIARLNGVPIGEEFVRHSHATRTLRMTASHGLRHGRNELRVTARLGNKVTKSTVKFTIAHDFPIVGAGRSSRAIVGKAHHLRGRINWPTKGEAPTQVRWSVVRAPKGSRFAPKPAARKAASRVTGAAAGQDPAVAPPNLSTPIKGLVDANTTSPMFTADKPGRYVLRMTVGNGAKSRSASVPVDIGPRSAVVELDTSVDGNDPAGTQSAGGPANGRPGIRVGGVIYRAPSMVGSDSRTSYSGNDGGRADYRAQWQVLVLDRKTLGLVSNQTFGICQYPSESRQWHCRRDVTGLPQRVFLDRELQQVDEDHLVIAVSHPSAGGNQRGWSAPGITNGDPTPLSKVGMPADTALLANAPSGGAAMIGVGTLDPGRAKYDVTTSGRAALRGHLVADINGHYDYISTTRSSFDTAPGNDCAKTTQPCDVRITIGSDKLAAPQPAGTSGFLITVHDERTLARRASRSFSSHVDMDKIHAFIEHNSAAGNLFAVTSFGDITTGGAIDRRATRAASEAIESIGGTKHVFNSALMSKGQRYTLIGWSHAGEGKGQEALRDGARLRGALSPNAAGKLRPANVSQVGEPAERLQQLLVAPTSQAWPLDDDGAASFALTWIGQRIPQLGGDPRQAYWRQSASSMAAAEAAVLRLRPPTVQDGVSRESFETAKEQLLTELDWVANVRDYFERLAIPSGTAGKTVWQEATVLQNRLEAEVSIAKEAAEKTTAGWMAVLNSLLSIASGGALSLDVAHSIEALVHVAMAAVEAGEASWELTHAGGEPVDEDPRVKADELAVSLEHRSQRTVDALYRMGNAIISDPRKLAEVGRWAGCLPNASSGGCPKGYEEYAVTPAATQQAANMARMALERTLYSELVPLSYGSWDVGVTANPDPEQNLWCTGSNWMSSPFHNAPRMAWTSGVEDVGSGALPTLSRVFVLVRRDGLAYSWPSQKVLDRMFSPVSGINESSGLGISPFEMMRDAEDRYEPGVNCSWGDADPPGPELD